MRALYILVACRFVPITSCGAYSSADSEILTDPTFTFTVSPPVRWTFYPPVAQTTTPITNFFPGQSETSQDAIQAAQNDIMASYLEAIASSYYPVTGSTLGAQVTYSPDQISNCYTTQMIPAGTMIGFLSAGAITQVALVSGTGTTGATATTCPLSTTMVVQGIGPYMDYSKNVQVSLRGGVTMSRFSWERIAAQMQSTLNFRYNAVFRSPMVITQN